ncbi:MAG: hypothetical protein QGH60_24320, partial [Phycisphaerae bacterium]|nr:hypothetical protein [Phycisphaerae bacterium]
DGRVIYTRWDYNDRGQLYPQPLYQMNIDGTAQTEYYGNNSWFPTTIGHARGIPGSDKILAIATGHHSIQTGALILIDVKKGRQETQGVTLVAPLVEDKKDRRYRRVDGYTGFNGHFQYPYPISETEYVAAYSAHQTRRRSKDGYGIYYVRQDAARELLVDDPKVSCNQPVFLVARKRPPVRPSVVDYKKKTGTYYVQDVYFGPGLKGIDRGVVKKLRVVSIGFRAAGVHSNGNGGPGGGALVSTPVAIRNGTWDTKTVIGETKVHSDGSAFFEAPARMPLYFQLIDADGYVVQSMRSWSTLMPGENFACIGCHEDKNATSPPTKTTMAMRAGPKPLADFYGKPRGFSYIKEIQPILDKHCIKCHMDRTRKGPAKKKDKPKVAAKPTAKTDSKIKKAFSLLAETSRVGGGRKWSDSYIYFTQNGRPNDMVKWLNVQSIPPMLPPYFAGSKHSKLMPLLKKGHYKAKLSTEELDKIACWIDLLVPYCGDYMEANAWGEKGEAKYRHFQKKRDDMAAIELRNIKILAGRK